MDPPLSFTRTKHHTNTTTDNSPFAAAPVIRLTNSTSNTTHSILTIPGQGWSIHNTHDHSILSSQKLPPTTTLSQPCFAFSIPDSPPHSQRSRFIYAPIASCPSDPDHATNQGRTIWVWIENEANRGFGERNTSLPSNSASANLIKTFHHPIQSVNPLPPNPTHSIQLARILVLLRSGTLHLTDERLTTLKSCSIHHPPNLLQETRHSFHLVQRSDHQLVYLSRCTPQLQTTTSTNPTKSNNKRKSSQNHPPASPPFSHYSQLQIHLLKLADADQLEPLAELSDVRDFLDLTISPQGWITILEPSRVLSTFCLSDPSKATTPQQSSLPRLTLLPHPQCGPIKLAICPRSDSSTLTPSLVTLPSSLPLVFLFTSHPNQPNTCLGLVLDLYHQAVLHVVQFAWPTPPKTLPSVSDDQAPQSISTSLSSFSLSDHLFMCLSYESLFVLQVLHPPQFSLDQPPTWVEILDPLVKQATSDWIICKADSQVQLTTNKTILLSESIASSHLFTLSPSSKNKKEDYMQLDEESSGLSKSLKSFVDRFNQIWVGMVQQSSTVASWDHAASKAAELAWSECVLTPMTDRISNEVHKKKSKLSTKENQVMIDKSDQEATLYRTLALILPKAFVQVLLSMCLGSYTESDSELEQAVAKKTTSYPRAIVTSLLKTGLVDDKMVRGGVIRALRNTKDVTMVELGMGRLIDVGESEVIETLHWVISQPPPTEGSDSAGHPLQYCLAKIVALSLDPLQLRRSIRTRLSSLDAFHVLNLLLVWIEWWDKSDSSSSSTTTTTSNDKLAGGGGAGSVLRRAQVPELKDVYGFLLVLLDSKFIELIKFNHPSHLDSTTQDKAGDGNTQVYHVLKRIKDLLDHKLHEDSLLLGLTSSLGQFSKLVKQQRDKKIKTKNLLKSSQKISTSTSSTRLDQNGRKYHHQNGRRQVQINISNSKFHYVNQNLLPKINTTTTTRPTTSTHDRDDNNDNNDDDKKIKNSFKKKSSLKISNSAASNLHHFVDYSLEKFSL